ncbi:hypothetical protein K1T71_004041 [Dendrolimus kikuchii]|uniref:Uncharacterized protein n=1 Tax=Dendrolimus kikuchii TaxID=765133 RepID=A0ACC1DB55_9NEOP|nr:hypothetical protein K1T71_004041 [Dendrolimus kikuchii]
MKYLGLVLDSRWDFSAHFRQLLPRLKGAAGALSRLLPNVGGPNATCRKLFEGIVRSMALYGAPVWSDRLTAKNAALLRQAQRILAVRAIRGYRTVSFEVASLLAGSPPWDLEARVLASLYVWRKEALARGTRPAPREIEACRSELRQVDRINCPLCCWTRWASSSRELLRTASSSTCQVRGRTWPMSNSVSVRGAPR